MGDKANKALDVLQKDLDVLGLGLDSADIINSFIYIARGNYGNAALSAAWSRSIPVVGVFTTGGKVVKAIDKAKDVAKAVDKIGDVAKGIKKGSKLVDGVSEVGKIPQKVIGHYPEYVEMSNKLGVKPFSIPDIVWNKMTSTEQWAANQKFLDRAIKKGSEFNLATPIDKVRPDSYLEKEIKYLISKGYKLNSDGTKFIK